MRHKSALLALICWTVVVYPADLVWHNPSHGPFFWREISVTADSFYIPSAGAILKSTNARDWSLHYQATTARLFSIAQSQDKLLAVADNADNPNNDPAWPAFY